MNWYKQYPKLSSYQFSWELCGVHLGESQPYTQNAHTKELSVIDNDYMIIGYCLDLPIRPRTNMVGIMFEHKHTFEKCWFHYLK